MIAHNSAAMNTWFQTKAVSPKPIARLCRMLALLGCVAGLQAFETIAQVVINEVMADNRSAVENGNEFPDYVELYNTGSQSVSLAGMSLTDDPSQPRFFVFPANSTIAARGYVMVWCDLGTTSPGLHSGFGLGSKGDRVRLYAANGSTMLDEVVFGLQLPNLSVGRVPNGTGSWTLTQPTARAANVAAPQAQRLQLRINEWMARPSLGEDWIEIFNGAPGPVALGGLIITDSTAAPITNRPIASLSFIAGRGHVQFFASDLKKQDADHLDFKISSSGETLSLLESDRTTVLDRVSMGAQTEDISQGRLPDGSDQVAAFATGQATPGEPNFGGSTGVVISEVLSHTDPPLEDAIELFNPTTAPIDISHWWLSDAPSQPKKYRIPAGTVLPAGGYRVFFEYQFSTGTAGFTLDSAEGDEVLLSAGDGNGNLTGQQTVVDFGALKNGVSVGRFITSIGVDFVPMSRRTFGVDTPSSNTQFRQSAGLSNASPRFGPVVINEIMFHPPEVAGQDNGDFEYIELHNPTDQTALLYDPLYPTNRWRLRDGTIFDFSSNRSMAPGGFLLLVGFDPDVESAKLQAFKDKYGVGQGVAILGPYSGKLSDAGEVLVVELPDEPQGPDKPNAGLVPYMLVERIEYAAAAPWPIGAGGTGMSLQRIAALQYGNEPLNWKVAQPTPGRINGEPEPADTDKDGIPDSWETSNGLNPSNNADAAMDPDGDIASNLQEYRAGTDPQDSQSVLKILECRIENDGMQLKLSGSADQAVVVETRMLVGQGDWQAVTNYTIPAGTNTLFMEIPRDSSQTRFYRLAIPSKP